MGVLYNRTHSSCLTLSILILAIVFGCSSIQFSNNIGYLPFNTVGKIPIVEGKINGKKAIFIVDTGASCSLLNESASSEFNFNYRVAKNTFVQSLTTESPLQEATNCTIHIGPIELRNHVFKTRDMAGIVSVILKHENVYIAGIIGADILNKYRMTIDFRNNILLFPAPEVKSEGMYASQNFLDRRRLSPD